MIHFDTNFLVSSLVAGTKEESKVAQLFRMGEELNISVMAWGEFLYGPVEQQQLTAAIRMLPKPEPILRQDAELAAMLFNRTGRRSKSFADCLIAACCMRVKAQLATNNHEDFLRFEAQGLRILAE